MAELDAGARDDSDPGDDARLRPGVEAAGWRREYSAWMVAVQPPDRPAAADIARAFANGLAGTLVAHRRARAA